MKPSSVVYSIAFVFALTISPALAEEPVKITKLLQSSETIEGKTIA